jgi:hypothetical protein
MVPRSFKLSDGVFTPIPAFVGDGGLFADDALIDPNRNPVLTRTSDFRLLARLET